MESTMVLANIIGGWGIVELGIILMVGLLIFGKRLPEVGRGLGRSISEFKRGISEAGNPPVTDVAASQPAALPANTVPAPALPPVSNATPTEGVEERMARLTAELQALQQEMAKQKDTPST